MEHVISILLVIKFVCVHYANTSNEGDYLNKCSFLYQVKLITALNWNISLLLYIRTHIIMDSKLVYPILANLNRLCVNCVLIVNLMVNKYNTIQYSTDWIEPFIYLSGLSVMHVRSVRVVGHVTSVRAVSQSCDIC